MVVGETQVAQEVTEELVLAVIDDVSDQRARLAPSPSGADVMQAADEPAGPRVVVAHHNGHALGDPTERGADGGGRCDLAAPSAVFQVSPAGFDDNRADGVGKQPLDFPFKSLALDSAAGDEIGQGFSFNRDDVFEAEH